MMTRIGQIALFWMCSFLASCAPTSLEDLRAEGEAQTRLLAEELRKIETKEDLQRAVPRLRERFNKIADLLIEVKKYSCSESAPSMESDALFAQLARIYEMPGGREEIERSQMQAVQKLQERF